MAIICSFFGHRDAPDKMRLRLYDEIKRHVSERGTDTFYVGGYGNFDNMVSSILHEIKGLYPHISVYQILAYMPTIENGKSNGIRHPTLYPDGLELVPKKFAIVYRNRWIINESDYIIAYVSANYGGAYEALKYARIKHKSIINLAEDVE